MICDLAETYHILDYRCVPARLLGTLICGLGENSRLQRAMSGQQCSLEALLAAKTLDAVVALGYGMSGQKKAPPSVADLLMERKERSGGFDSVEAFEAARERIIKGGAP